MGLKVTKGVLLVISIAFSIIMLELFTVSYYKISPYDPIMLIDKSSGDRQDVDFVIIGDSVCAGLFIGEGESFDNRLIGLLSNSSVVSLCHPGADMLDYYAAFNRFLTGNKPKDIIFLITMYNDFQNRGFFVFNENLISIDKGVQYSVKSDVLTLSAPYNFILDNVKSLRFVVSRLGNILFRYNDLTRPITPYQDHAPESHRNKIDYRSNILLLQSMMRSSKNIGADVHLITYPYPFDYSLQKENRLIVDGYISINKLCKDNSINCYHLINLFSKIRDSDKMTTKDRLHPDGRLSKIMADFVYSKVR